MSGPRLLPPIDHQMIDPRDRDADDVEDLFGEDDGALEPMHKSGIAQRLDQMSPENDLLSVIVGLAPGVTPAPDGLVSTSGRGACGIGMATDCCQRNVACNTPRVKSTSETGVTDD